MQLIAGHLKTNMEEKLDNYPPKLSSYNYNTLKKKWSSNLKLQLAVAIGFIPFPQKLNVFTLRMIGESPVIDAFSIYELVVSFFWGKYGRRKRNSGRRGNKNSFESSYSVLDLGLKSGAEEDLIMFFFFI
ncbi:uncharacterized protein [Malus domestica]|uniref:uncharacterized protein n=1 Tax=Malus domestica TaxID=3750 RepID=UPI003974EC85